MHILIEPKEDYHHRIQHWMKEHGIHKVIGFSGGADDKLPDIPEDHEVQKKCKDFKKAHFQYIIEEALRVLRAYRVAILTGGTKWGVPALTINLAKRYGFYTIGVYPQRGEKYALGDDLLDLRICVPPQIGESKWGDETPIWVAICDAVIVLGGGSGTLTECSHLMKVNESLVEKNRTPKYIVPIAGTGGAAEKLHDLWAKPEIREASMPTHKRIYSGREAANLIIEKIDLHVCFDPYFYHGFTQAA